MAGLLVLQSRRLIEAVGGACSDTGGTLHDLFRRDTPIGMNHRSCGNT
jgi:hypothetical protein